LISGQKLEKLEIALNVAGFKISGTMDNVGTAGMVLYRYAALKPKDMIRSWICHLILNRQQTENLPDAIRQTILAGKDRTILFHPVEANSSLLEQLLSIYWQGLTEPLDFFPRASFIFAQAVHNGKSEQEAWQRAAREWEGNRHTGPGEKYDPYNTLCCKSNQLSEKNFANLAKKIFLPLLAHQAPYQQ
jgi:exodeoxyribonuclease V gamma subunit